MNSSIANLAALASVIEEETKKAQSVFSEPIKTEFDFKPEPKKFYAAASIKPKEEKKDDK